MPAITRKQVIQEAAATSSEPHHSLAGPEQIESAVQRRQTSNASKQSFVSTLRTRYPNTPPRFTIDLSFPPEQRYLEVCAAFQQEISDLTPLFDEVVGGMIPAIPLSWLHFICKTLLRGIYDADENKELKGISRATGVAMYLLVCFNVLLDLFMGCSSGGAAVRDGENGSKMLHFRTLEWGMPSLRKIVVQLDYKLEPQGPIVASTVTYAGYVGVLTGVKRNLSVSLNFRPNRNEKGKLDADMKYFWHLLMVLLGRRRSISSELRRFLLPEQESRKGRSKETAWKSMTYSEVVHKASCRDKKPLKTTACYLCFSNEDETTILEKDYTTAVVRSSDGFIVITNNDVEAEDESSAARQQTSQFVGALQAILDEAQDRRKCAGDNYNAMRLAAAKDKGVDMSTNGGNDLLAEDDIVQLVQKYPTTNEETHFACVMDPKEGTVKWCRRWVRPISEKWIREHWSPTSTW